MIESAEEMKPIVKIKKVNKYYCSNRVIKDLSLDVYEGEFLTILGPSGCGKTTTLRMIAGFESVTDGEIYLKGMCMHNRPPNKRDVHTVFQNFALFPHMNVENNIAFGLKIKHMGKEDIKFRVERILRQVRLGGYEKHMPSQLSGGQQQRVAIARALVGEPPILLLDEPLCLLDIKLGKKMQMELRQLQKDMGITFIYVTHDQEEAFVMSDRIAVMNNGMIEQIGTPREIYEQPKNRFVARFVGENNIFNGLVNFVAGNRLGVVMECGWAMVKGSGLTIGQSADIFIRSEKLMLTEKAVEGFNMPGTVKEHRYTGQMQKVIVEMNNAEEEVVCRLTGQHLPPVGTKVFLYWDIPDSVAVCSKEVGKENKKEAMYIQKPA